MSRLKDPELNDTEELGVFKGLVKYVGLVGYPRTVV